jgi:hypothetical protein
MARLLCLFILILQTAPASPKMEITLERNDRGAWRQSILTPCSLMAIASGFVSVRITADISTSPTIRVPAHIKLYSRNRRAVRETALTLTANT